MKNQLIERITNGVREMNATEPTPALICTPPARGFGNLPCLRCNETCGISLDLDDGTTLRCVECGEEFTTEEVQDFIAAWTPVLVKINKLFA